MSSRRSGQVPRVRAQAGRPALVLAALAATVTLLAGCGDATSSTTAGDPTSPTLSSTTTDSGTPTDSSSPADSTSPSVSTSPTHSAPRYPSCLTIWVKGKTLPGGYEGCQLGGKLTPVAERPCEFGKALLTFGTHFYAVPGGRIHRTPGDVHQDKGYQRALLSCGG